MDNPSETNGSNEALETFGVRKRRMALPHERGLQTPERWWQGGEINSRGRKRGPVMRGEFKVVLRSEEDCPSQRQKRLPWSSESFYQCVCELSGW